MKIFRERQNQKDNFLEKLTVLGILFILAFLYYSDTFSYWFFSDDPAALVSSTESLREIFFEHNYSAIFYTPLVGLSFKPDVFLFGMNPLPYHIHNVIVLVLIAFLVYLILRRYTDRISSFPLVVIILLSIPSLVCIIWITLRQYLYAMLFALLVIYLFLEYKPDLKSKKFITLIILILCELSFLGKEQYMTLPFIIFILSEGNLKQRIYKTYPYFLLLLGHFLLRWYVLGSTGGYVGVCYDPRVYAKTIFESILITSKVLFGFTWVVIPIALLFLLKSKRALLSLLLWLTSLSISFLVMSYYPSAVSYRYWFIPMIVFTFLLGLTASLIRNSLLKVLFLLIIMTLFLHNTLIINKDLKAFFKNETLVAQKVSESIVDRRYSDSIFLFPDNTVDYIHRISQAYDKIAGIKPVATFYPLELLVVFPEIIKEFRGIYEFKGSEVVNITNSMEEKINSFKKVFSDEKASAELLKRDDRTEITLQCRESKSILTYFITKTDNKYYTTRRIFPYMEKIDITPFLKDAKLFPVESLSYHKGAWYIAQSPVSESASFIVAFCIDQERKHTLLSSVLYIPQLKW